VEVPEATIAFRSSVDPPTLRRLLAEPTFIAGKIPQVVAVERTSETTALWTVQIKLGPISKKSIYKGELLETTDQTVRFRATGPEATIDGTIVLAPAAPSGTNLTLTLSMKGSGPLRSVVDAYLAKRVREDAEKFASSIEGDPSLPAPATP
jgi:carbon monoxide dehydrogenase subunit G